VLPSEDDGIDFEGEVVVIVAAVAMGVEETNFDDVRASAARYFLIEPGAQ